MQDRSKQLVGEAPSWLTALEHASRVAPLDRSVLVIGERGTGKELVGERLHFLSKRWEGPFVKVNCGKSFLLRRMNCGHWYNAGTQEGFRALPFSRQRQQVTSAQCPACSLIPN